MGLSIHYRLESSSQTDTDVRGLVERLRQKALTLPVKEVGDLVDLCGDDCDHWNVDANHPLNWMLIQAVHRHIHDRKMYELKPMRVIAFSIWPGAGCEEANIGLCRYPKFFTDYDGEESKFESEWLWQSFCKTQYASNPSVGGLEHFVRCHLSVIAVLDYAKKLGLDVTVKDEGKFWEHRDVIKLATLVEDINVSMAAFAGVLKDMIGSAVQSEIGEFPNFERLEAKGREKDS